ncbi:CheR family methyltransferase [Nitrosospira briensis]|uniref:CheR family methyltransferase n=1 Tax=Nitrosospira briensis TaxID=35799 RepID=UPI0008EEBF65|nr:CheR family methyltransferase [Nitrosospira briensis]SFN98669.1 MCP methyltransferase, CheR-type [Nitrosospira briensis]
MQNTVPHPLLPQLSRLLTMEMGLYYPEKCWGDLERRVAAAAPALGMPNTEACIHQLLSASLTRRQIEILARHLTVGETYFFREKGCFDVLEARILPELMRACAREHRQLRIWSAGCCTGEEPYSIAILLDRLMQNTGEPNVTILATDINPIFLEKAAAGVYNKWSFRGTAAWIKERYFKPRKDGQFEILPNIRKQVTFSYLNLAEGYPDFINDTEAMDLIFCRNVLMYFSPDGVLKIGQSFHRSLVNGGWLILSPVEISTRLFPKFKLITFPEAALYHKNESPPPEGTVVKYPVLPELPDPPEDVNRIPTRAFAPPLYLLDKEMPAVPECVPAEPLIKGIWAQAARIHNIADGPKDHEEFETLCNKARSYANAGQLTEAVGWCEKAIAVNKLNPAVHYLLATICQELGQSTMAKQSLTRTIYLDPEFVLAHFTLGSLCMFDDQHCEAERHFNNTLALLALSAYDKILPESNGLTAGRLKHIITSVRSGISPGPRKNKHND